MPPHDDDTPIVPMEPVQPDEHPMTSLRRSVETAQKQNREDHKLLFKYLNKQDERIADHETRITVAEKDIDDTEESIKGIQANGKEKSKETRGFFYAIGGGVILFLLQYLWSLATGKKA